MKTTAELLHDLGITLPTPAKAVANYVPWVRSGQYIYISGQVALVNGTLVHPGKLGDDLTIEEGAAAARQCAINVLAQLNEAVKCNFDNVVRIVKLTGFVNATPDFKDHPKVVNGASDLMVEVFGDRGRHARSAVGSSSLPLGVSVEVEAIIEVR